MRRMTFLVLGAVAACLMLYASPALADNGVHVMGAGLTPDSCAGCHRLHTAPAPLLLKQDGTQLCYTCHGIGGTGSKLDVESGVQYDTDTHTGAAQALRGGGFKFALIDSSRAGLTTTAKTVNVLAAGQAVTSTHSVNASNVTAWGNETFDGTGAVTANPQFGTTIQLRCGSCHDPHGNGYYRILRPKPQQSGLPRTSTAASVGGVGILDVQADASGMKGYTTTNYWDVSMNLATIPAPTFTPSGTPPSVGPNNMPFNGIAANTGTGQPLVSGIAAWCSTCHTKYLAASGSNETNVLNDPVFSYRHTSNREITASLNARNCVQCHVAHGSNASMGPKSGATNTPDNTADPGGSKLLRVDNRGVCQICHNK